MNTCRLPETFAGGSVEFDRGVVVVRIDDPETGNALTPELEAALRSVLACIARDDRVRCLVLAGDRKVFCSGGRREELLSFSGGERSLADLDPVTHDLVACPVPTIAAMAGSAVGAGFMLGLACDVIVLGRESRYGANFMDLGFTPGYGATALLETVVPSLAAELMFTAEYRKGGDFAGHGVNHVLPRSEVENKALDLAQRISEKPRRALEALKRMISARRMRRMAEARGQEHLMHMLTMTAESSALIEERYHG